jgi:hypothetical protein
LGLIGGKVIDQNKNPIRGYVENDGKIIRIENEYFELGNIPLDKFKLRVIESINGSLLHEEDVSTKLTGLCKTKANIIITKK